MATLCTDAGDRPGLSWPTQVLIGLAATGALVIGAYFFVDLPVLRFFRGSELYKCHYQSLKWLTRPPEVFVIFSPFVLLACLVRRWFAPWTWAEKAATAAAVSTLATALAVLLLKIAFGRSSPNVEEHGFAPLNFDSSYWAFPSGHTACTLAVLAVLQIAVPRWRLCWWSAAGIVGTALVVLNYHFVGDILGGAFLGWAVGGTAARWFGIGSTLLHNQPLVSSESAGYNEGVSAGSPLHSSQRPTHARRNPPLVRPLSFARLDGVGKGGGEYPRLAASA